MKSSKTYWIPKNKPQEDTESELVSNESQLEISVYSL